MKNLFQDNLINIVLNFIVNIQLSKVLHALNNYLIWRGDVKPIKFQALANFLAKFMQNKFNSLLKFSSSSLLSLQVCSSLCSLHAKMEDDILRNLATAVRWKLTNFIMKGYEIWWFTKVWKYIFCNKIQSTKNITRWQKINPIHSFFHHSTRHKNSSITSCH